MKAQKRRKSSDRLGTIAGGEDPLELLAGDFSWLDAVVVGPEGVRQLVLTSRREYADLYIKIEDQIAEDDLVVTRWRERVRMLDAHPRTGRTGSCSGIAVIRLMAGKQGDSQTAVS